MDQNFVRRSWITGGELDMDLLGTGREIIEQDPVCNVCLGRVFADRSHGLSNEERGKAVRISLSMIDDVPYPDRFDRCWVCEGQSENYLCWANRAVDMLHGIEFSTYQVGTRVPPLIEENDRLLRESVNIPPDIGDSFKSDLNREVGKRIGSSTGTEVNFDRSDVLILLHVDRESVEIQINPAFVFGRYRKLERGIPQTEWPCTDCGSSGKQLGPEGEEPCSGCGGSGYRYDDSIEGLTVPTVVEVMDGTEGTFHGAGREDVDARMLGTGRPFVIEVKQPRVRTPSCQDIERLINESAAGRVNVDGLRLVTHEMVERVKTLPASKTYEMKIEFSEPVSEADFQDAIDRLNGETIDQRTPRRVSGRRADRVRKRDIYAIDGEMIDDIHAKLRVHGEGGLYIKELVSGDLQRTDPSIAGEIGVEANVTALDVIEVDGEEEPFIRKSFLVAPEA